MIYKSFKDYLAESTIHVEKHAIAQRNASMPVSHGGLGLPKDNTAIDRAKAMGYDVETKMYHGTPYQDNIDSFSLGGVGRRTGDLYGVGLYMSNKPSTTYSGSHGQIIPMYVRKHELLDIDNPSDTDMHNIGSIYKANIEPHLLSRINGKMTKVFKKDDIENAKAFFNYHRDLYDVHGKGYDRNKPSVDSDENGDFVIHHVDYEANPIIKKDDIHDVFKDIGYDAVRAMGYKGHIMKAGNETWNVLNDTSQARSIHAAFAPMKKYSTNLLD